MDKKPINCLMREGRLVIYISSDLDHHHARGVREEIDHAIFLHRPTEVSLDFRGVSFMDSSALALILGRAELGRELGIRIKLVGLSPAHKRLVRLGGIDRIGNILIAADTED